MEAKRIIALQAAAKMLVDNGLGDWHLNIKDVTSYHAQTYYRPKIINISIRMIILATKEQFVGIMNHEIAHALIGPGEGHGKKFKKKVYELTGSHEYAGYASRVNTKKFLAHCPICNTHGSTNRTMALWCSVCFRKGIKSRLKITKNNYKLVEWK